MTDKPREWPNRARDVRDRAAEAAQAGINALEDLVHDERSFSETERIRRESKALSCLEKIVRLLESVGAQTRP
jgi:hypothetical protein